MVSGMGRTLPADRRAAPAAMMEQMGFNPFRAQRRQAADYVLVAAAAVVIVALLLWAAW
jgi:hypothetical protein